MRNIMKATTLESRFPLLSVEHGCIVSKDADITAAFEVELPEVYTVTAEEYEGIHATWCKAIKVLPDHSVLPKQDWYVKERYRPDLGKEGMGFLARSYEMHFNERPFLHHKCYLFLTKTTKERMRQQSNWNTLCRGHIVPKEIQDKETAVKFIEAVEQFARILNDSGHIKLRRLSDDELTGTDKETGIIGRYFALSLGNADCLEDIEMTAREMRVGDNRLCLHNPVGHGGPARSGGHGLPLRKAVHRPLGLPPVLRRAAGTAAALQPHLQPVCLHRQQRRGTAPLRENGEEHAVALPVQPPERHQPRVD